MLYGDNVVDYTPVEAYPVMTMDVGIISGGTGGNATTTQGVQFFWVFNPTWPDSNPSGFTGQGWFAETEGSPIWYSIQFHSMTLDGILSEFASGRRISLNDVFTNWQNYVNAAGSQGNDVVQQFQQKLGWICWRNLSNSQ